MNGQNSIDNEIDLKNMFNIIWDKKLVIIALTGLVTVLSVVFALTRTPIYQSKAVIELGSYKVKSGFNVIDDSRKLAQELNVLFIDILKSELNRKAKIVDISTINKQKNFIKLVAQGLSTDETVKELEKVIAYMQTKHKKLLDEVISNKRLELQKINDQLKLLQENKLVALNEDISYLKQVELPSLDKKLAFIEKKISKIQSQINITQQNIIKIQSKNPSLAALNVMEKRNLEESLSDLKLHSLDLKDKQTNLELKVLPRLLRNKSNLLSMETNNLLIKKNIVEQSLLSHNYKNTQVVGKIISTDYPVKPKKRLIVTVGFVAGFTLSVILVLIISFNRERKK